MKTSYVQNLPKMSDIKRTTVTAFMGAMALGLNMQLPAHSQLTPYCQKVNYPIGLIVRAAPTSSSRRVGSLAYRQRVRLDGKLKRVGTGTNSLRVTPTTAQDSQGTTWVKIKAPIRGFVLFATGSDTDSLIPCQ